MYGPIATEISEEKEILENVVDTRQLKESVCRTIV